MRLFKLFSCLSCLLAFVVAWLIFYFLYIDNIRFACLLVCHLAFYAAFGWGLVYGELEIEECVDCEYAELDIWDEDDELEAEQKEEQDG